MKRVLIADDSRDFSRFLKSALQTLEYKLSIHTVSSAEEAVQEASKAPLALLVSDVRLPVITGFDLVKQVRAIHPAVRVILITGLKSSEIRRQAEELEVDAFFTKPMALDDFLGAVKRCFEDVPAPQLGLVQSSELGGAGDRALPAGLSGLLSGLRQHLNACTVLLLEASGHIVAQAGELPVPVFETDWAPRLLNAARAQNELSHFLGSRGFENVLALRGKSFALALAPAGGHVLAVVLNAAEKDVQLVTAYQVTLTAQKALQEILQQMGMEQSAEVPASASPVEEVDASDISGLAKLLEKPEQVIKAEDVDAFWDSLSAEKKLDTGSLGGITYEQARQMGLTLEDEG